jgi:hypothetical protein
VRDDASGARAEPSGTPRLRALIEVLTAPATAKALAGTAPGSRAA